MKKFNLTLVAFIFALSTAVVAQPRQNRQQHQAPCMGMQVKDSVRLSPQKRAGYMAVDLELTDAQRKKLEAFFVKQDKQRETQRAEMAKSREQQKLKAEEARKANQAELEKILGSEKYAQHKAQIEERQNAMKNRRADMAKRPGNNQNWKQGNKQNGNKPAPRGQNARNTQKN